MAFCPECGKAVSADVASCATCGYALPNTRKAGAPRFNGTVMMAAPVAVKAVQPANANAEASANAAAAQAAASANVALDGRVAVGAGSVSAGHVGKLAAGHAGKPTMLGAGIAPRAQAVEPVAPPTPAVRAVVDVPVSPIPGRPIPSEPIGHAQTQAALPNAARAAPEAAPYAGAPHYLPGDPMAPQPSAADHLPGRSQRLHIDHEPPPGLPKEERIWLYWAVCGVVVLSVLVLAIGLF